MLARDLWAGKEGRRSFFEKKEPKKLLSFWGVWWGEGLAILLL
jgi:hypothetical protein